METSDDDMKEVREKYDQFQELYKEYSVGLFDRRQLRVRLQSMGVDNKLIDLAIEAMDEAKANSVVL